MKADRFYIVDPFIYSLKVSEWSIEVLGDKWHEMGQGKNRHLITCIQEISFLIEFSLKNDNMKIRFSCDDAKDLCKIFVQ